MLNPFLLEVDRLKVDIILGGGMVDLLKIFLIGIHLEEHQYVWHPYITKEHMTAEFMLSMSR